MEEKVNDSPEKGGEGNKIEKQFNECIALLGGWFGGETVKSKGRVRVKEDRLKVIADKLLAKRSEELEKKVETQASALLDEMINYNISVEKAKQEFQNTIDAKRKEFINKAKDLEKMIEGGDKMKQLYIATLKGAIPGEEEAK
jgi:hypothetical protein